MAGASTGSAGSVGTDGESVGTDGEFVGTESAQNRSRPLIGITTYPPNRRGRFELPREYVDSVRRAGGEPVLITPGVGDLAGLVARLDGVVLAGGGDIDPALHGGGTHETIYALHPERDRDELALVPLVLDHAIPTLAICRGSQVLNVALGGSLHLHLPDVVDGSTLHRDEEAARQNLPAPVPHPVEVDARSHLAAVMGATAPMPMSWHHQAIDRLGDGLRVVARAPDGTVEATEHDSHPWLVSVQWHPELTAATDPTQQRLFDGLVDAVRTRPCGGHQ